MATREAVHLTGGLQPLLRARRAVREDHIATLMIERQRLLRLIEHYREIPGAASPVLSEAEATLEAARRRCQEAYAAWSEALGAWQALRDQGEDRGRIVRSSPSSSAD